jgi:putative ABC transport system ATP-binding protein
VSHEAGSEWLAIQGRTGHGKTTLLHLLGGLDRPSTGIVGGDPSDIDSYVLCAAAVKEC